MNNNEVLIQELDSVTKYIDDLKFSIKNIKFSKNEEVLIYEQLSKMREYQMKAKEKVEIELKDLECKLNKLHSFMLGGDFANLSKEMRDLMYDQRFYMKRYIDTLARRLVIWDQK